MSKYLIVCAILSCILDCKQSEVSREMIIRMDLKKMHQIDMHGEYARQICLILPLRILLLTCMLLMIRSCW